MKPHAILTGAGGLALALTMAAAGAQMPASPSTAMSGQTMSALPQTRQVDGISYVTGGFGLDESTALKNAISDYSVGMVFSEKSGAYAGDVQVELKGSGSAPSASLTSSGPYLLMNLPDGRYSATATWNGKPITKSFTVSGNRGQRIGFAW